MKRLLLAFLTIVSLTAQAEEKELKIQVQVTPSPSVKFPINELQFQWENYDGLNQLAPLTWNAQNKSFEGTINIDLENYYESFYLITTPDKRIYYRGLLQTGMLWDESVTSVEDHADFSAYHYVEVTPASQAYTVDVIYLGSPRTNDGNIASENMLGVHTNLINSATYLRAGNYECDVTSKDKNGILIGTEPQFFTVDGEDVSYSFDTDFESMHLVTFLIKDANNQPATDASINWATLSETLSLTTDQSGKAQIYLKNGEYFYAPLINAKNYISSAYDIGEKLTVAGQDVTTEYSYKEKDWFKQDFIIKGNEISYANLTIKNANQENYHYQIDLENGQGQATIYTYKGRYQYAVTADHYSFDYAPVNKIADFDKNNVTEINFNRADYRNVAFPLRNIPETYSYSLDIYREDGMPAAGLDQSFSNEESVNILSKTRTSYQEDPTKWLLPGKYYGILHLSDNQYEKYNKIIFKTPFEIDETNENEVLFDVAAQQYGTITCAITNIPEEVRNVPIIAYISDQEGIILDTLYRSDDWQTLEKLQLPAGKYTMHWRNQHFGSNYDSEIALALAYDEEFELKANETYQATLNFNQLGITKIMPEIAENDVIWGFVIEKDNIINAADNGYDTSADYFYFAGNPGEYQIRLWGMQHDDFAMNLQSKNTSFSNMSGQINELEVPVDQTSEGLSCLIYLCNHFGAPINNAVVTVNGKQQSVSGLNMAYQNQIAGDILNISIEAPGYETYTMQRSLSEIIKTYGYIEITCFLNPGSEATGMQQTALNETAVMRTNDNELVISSADQTVWNYRILDLQGITIISGRTQSSATTIELDQIKSGIYILELTQGKEKRVLKFVR